MGCYKTAERESSSRTLRLTRYFDSQKLWTVVRQAIVGPAMRFDLTAHGSVRSRSVMKSFCRARLFWVLILFLPGKLLAEDIVIGMSAAFTGPSRALGIELYRGSMA